MWNRFLSFLAWAGLWEPSLIVFNRDSPVLRQPVNSTHIVDLTSDFMARLLEGYSVNDGKQLSYLALEKSVFYKQGFLELGALLRSADPLLMEPAERKTLFINVYNLLTIQAIVSRNPLPESTISVPNFWRRYAYQVGPYSLHLDDIEHGILRGNRPHPTSGTTMFLDDDPRLALTLPADHRIHGALNCGARSCPPLQAYYTEQLDQQLDEGLNAFCNGSVKLLGDNSLIINSIFQWFRVDFGSTEASVLEWLAEQVTDDIITQALLQASNGQRRFSYNYDWTLNAVSGAGGGKVKVDVYFSSLCSDTVRFFTTQLYPAWTQLQDIMDLNLVPFGKAKASPLGNGDYHFDCQHGPNECYGNKVMACIQNSFPIATQVKMIHCMMTKGYPAFAGPECSREQGVEWADLERCSQSSTASAYLYQNGVKTSALKPSVYFIPTITIDGQYGQSQLRTSLGSLKDQICQFHKGPPHQNCV
ncbi:uncharacterized protein LOC135094032 isoform X1 [Scylla paramamosain]|uniref:uncharacterized protein LOC135094032 isoform X1 n=1 Tax=Scylla paramamosain TaxID=85552 RepID=UPI003083B676